MPKLRRSKLPEALLVHLLTRMRERGVSFDQLADMARWMDTEPEVPRQKWFKRFVGFVVCGEGELIKSFLLPGQAPEGQEIQ